MGACCPITLPVTVGLGGSTAVALNALASVAATGGVGALLRSRPTDSLDALFIIDGRGLSSARPFARPYSVFEAVGRAMIADDLTPMLDRRA